MDERLARLSGEYGASLTAKQQHVLWRLLSSPVPLSPEDVPANAWGAAWLRLFVDTLSGSYVTEGDPPLRVSAVFDVATVSAGHRFEVSPGDGFTVGRFVNINDPAFRQTLRPGVHAAVQVASWVDGVYWSCVTYSCR